MAEHIPEVCRDDCTGCGICEGGLFKCSLCGGAEGSLPSECPGESLIYEEHVAIYEGRLDFKGGKWVPGPLIVRLEND